MKRKASFGKSNAANNRQKIEWKGAPLRVLTVEVRTIAFFLSIFTTYLYLTIVGYIQDDLINRTVLQKRLKLDGHEVVTTTDGQQAVDKIDADNDFDCILMDIQCVVSPSSQRA